ncbi:MFS transporter [Cyathus striatus]|nr:MFS transporter [Cyathus striatus]
MATPSVHDGDDVQLTRRILWKLDCRILPPLALLWLANFIDRSNIGNARIVGLERDAHLHGDQFNTVLAVFYVSYLLVEIPSNIILKRMRPNRWIPLLVGLWGTVTTLTSLVHNFQGLLAIRIFLGLCEGGLLPGIILYLSTIYKRHELQLRVGVFYASGLPRRVFDYYLFSFPLWCIWRSSRNGNIQNGRYRGLAGWRWIYILEGIATVLCSLIAAYFLPADLSTASFLTEEERNFAVWRFRAGDMIASSNAGSERPLALSPIDSKEEKNVHVTHTAVMNPLESFDSNTLHQDEEEFEWREVIRGFLDIQTWLTGMAYFGLIVSLYSYSLFLPTIVTGLGYSGSAAQLHTVPPYVPATVLTVVVAILSDRLKWRGPFILICLPLAIIGYIMAITTNSNTVRYVAVFLMAAGVYPSAPCILSILPNNSSGHFKKATTTALQLAVANNQAPKYIRGHTIVLSFLVLTWVLIAVNISYCLWENKARREGRRQSNLEHYKELRVTGKTRAPIGDRHPDFRFTL